MKLTHLIFALGLFGGLANAFAYGDDGGLIPAPLNPLLVTSTCTLGTGLFPLPTGFGDARKPLAVVGKSGAEILSGQFMADDLVEIPYELTSPEQVALFKPGYFETLRRPAANALVAMIRRAQADHVLLALHSGFRAYITQCQVFNHKMTVEFTADPTLAFGRLADETRVVLDVNTRSAFPGESEHQLGTAMDLVTNIPGLGWKLEPEMDHTPAFAWLQANAYKFGFVLSYPKGAAGPKAVNARTGYVYEPWHWRYIGVVPAARYRTCVATRLMTTNDFLRRLNENPNFTCGH